MGIISINFHRKIYAVGRNEIDQFMMTSVLILIRASLVLVATSFMVSASSVFATEEFHPGEVWPDTNGHPIQAHGGGILVHDNIFYWYGEDRTPGGHGAVACYSSTNLYDWKHEGVALATADLPVVDNQRTFVERPKVIFNSQTKKFVMWFHLEQKGYRYSRAGIATSDTPAGPFRFLQAIRPVADTNAFANHDEAAQNLLGGTFRDMNLFLDDDGHAYVFYSSAGNWTMYVVRLNADFTGPEIPLVENKNWARILVRQMREGPAPFKFDGHYYLITSACTGWSPNAADGVVAENILGPYHSLGNPCTGTMAAKTFGAQSTFVLPVPGTPGNFIFMADQWRPADLSDSRYVWLPFNVGTNRVFTISWRNNWDLSIFK
jgi:hypothetical protein